MISSSNTVGEKANETPNLRYSIPSCPSRPAGTGIGISPPAKKLAVSPDIATRLGSASVRTMPLSSKASIRRSRAALPIPPKRTLSRTGLFVVSPVRAKKSPGSGCKPVC